LSEKLVIQGGVPLTGQVTISGAKNSVLKLMAASLLTEEDVVLTNVPQLSDVNVMIEVVRHLGCKVKRSGNTLVLSAKGITSSTAPYELVSKMRASFNVLGGLLGRCHEARVSLPGGCSIGKRGVDLHIKGLQALGAEVEISHGYVEAKAKKLVGAEIHLDMPSVGATENIMLTAVLAEGSTIISNAAQEPEIVDLAHFLNALGADVSGAGTHEIIINGVPSLHGAEYHVLPDRIEAATYMIAAAATRGDVLLENVVPAHFSSVVYKLTEMGSEITTPTPNALRIKTSDRLMAQNLVTQPYPGFPTDLQAPFMALLSVADGVSVLTETIYENRFKQVGELKRMGAQIQQEGDVAIITGVDSLYGAPVKASDLRAGAALVIAGLQAQGKTDILDIHHIDRGYELLVEKLRGLGATISRVSLEEELLQVEQTV
jgi:UDP-N-acetylglucosamine 1-carboxyvinyltransferase